MSKLARSYSDKHGLKDLIKEFAGTDINKSLQSSDFGGELSEKQLQYCAKDVIYLHKIYDSLKKILIREKRDNLYTNSIKFILSGLFKFSQKLTNQIAIISEKTFEIFGAVTKSPLFPNGFFF